MFQTKYIDRLGAGFDASARFVRLGTNSPSKAAGFLPAVVSRPDKREKAIVGLSGSGAFLYCETARTRAVHSTQP